MPLTIPITELHETKFNPVSGRNSVATNAFVNPLEEFSKVLTKEQQIKDETDARNAVNAYNTNASLIGYDPENGYYNEQGSNAVSQAPSYLEKLKLAQESNGEELNYAARQLYNEQTDKSLVNEQGSILEYSMRQNKIAELASLDNQATNAQTQAERFYADPKKLALQNQDGLLAVMQKVDKTGGDSEAREDAINQFQDTFYYKAMNSALSNGDSPAARELLEQYDGWLTSAHRFDIKSKLGKLEEVDDENANLAYAQSFVDSNFHPGASISSNVNRAKYIKNPEVRKLAEQMMRKKSTDYKQDKTQAELNAFSEVSKMVEGGQSASTIPKALLATMNPAHRQYVLDIPHWGKGNGDLSAILSSMPTEQLRKLDINGLMDIITKGGLDINGKGFEQSLKTIDDTQKGVLTLKQKTLDKVMLNFDATATSVGIKIKSKQQRESFKSVYRMLGGNFADELIENKLEETGEGRLTKDQIINISSRIGYTYPDIGTFFDGESNLLELPMPILASIIYTASQRKTLKGETFEEKLARIYVNDFKGKDL
ncbi:hypothetical protein BJAS_P3454 [Bathymodiolus japonicus methanotrophic gill symbiont]|uniref:hypothetical protein n=1 Tax=Bathymodiolus japonicus methanotrophic gill symbiont TaxID=113269 RepID=UPI001B6B9088|nr:hypothetical protein [Bathymodiolus japonicus methanotrophic gill symbiont]GFO72917.1 hypothetical protein BJAS_P3454 [Bathymodiolus japonicus methanotrophic gill symbiont]